MHHGCTPVGFIQRTAFSQHAGPHRPYPLPVTLGRHHHSLVPGGLVSYVLLQLAVQ